MAHYTYRDTSEVHWNELLPGDTFCIGDNELDEDVMWQLTSKHQIFVKNGSIVTVISRRIGPELPKPRDYYVLLLQGPRLTPELLL